MIRNVSCTVNSKPITLQIDVRMSLAEVLRKQGYTSVKEGCGVGECGACTVLIDGVAIDSCLYLAVWVDGKNIRTVDGENKKGELTPIQQAYLDTGSVQCGFCTPGLVMASTAFVEKHQGDKVTREEIRRGHAGNLCRCTGYEGIIRAVEQCMDSEKDRKE